jgi:hypothetical protein
MVCALSLRKDLRIIVFTLRQLNTLTEWYACTNNNKQIQFGWCRDADNRVSPLWSEACDVTSPLFGTRSLIIDPKTKQLKLPDGSESVDAFQVSSLTSSELHCTVYVCVCKLLQQMQRHASLLYLCCVRKCDKCNTTWSWWHSSNRHPVA